MKRKSLTLMVLACLLLLATGNAMAQHAQQTVEVFAEVGPQIEMLPAADVFMGPPNGNVYEGTATFEVHGNTQYVDFYVEATCLYKGSTSTSINIIPISGSGATVVASDGQPVDGDAELLDWVTGALTWQVLPDTDTGIGVTTLDADGVIQINGMQGNQSEVRRYESGQGGSFSQDVSVTCEWENPNTELPVGQYGGYVKLTAIVVPDPTGPLSTPI